MNTYLLPSSELLWNALRLCDDPAAWTRPVERWQRVDPAGGEPAWLLRCTEPLDALADWACDAATDPARPGPAVVEQRQFTSLLAALPLRPTATAELADISYLLLPDTAALADAARANLMLDNDQLAWQAMDDGRALLRVHRLSAFLAERWRHAADLLLLQPASSDTRVLVPLGWDLPLADKVRLVAGGDAQHWLVEPDRPAWTHLTGPFEDIYELIEIASEDLRLTRLSPGGRPPAIRVPLRLEPTEERERPRLWLLPPGNRRAVERLVREATEDELHNLQIARLIEPDGTERYLLRDRQPVNAGPLADQGGGDAYYPRLPEEQLYLPVGYRLAPVLARRSLVEALSLSAERLTLLSAGPDDQIQIRQIDATTLLPLPDLVEYLAGEASPAVNALIDAVRFDFAGDAAAEAPAETTAPAGWWTDLLRWWRSRR